MISIALHVRSIATLLLLLFLHQPLSRRSTPFMFSMDVLFVVLSRPIYMLITADTRAYHGRDKTADSTSIGNYKGVLGRLEKVFMDDYKDFLSST